MNILDVIGADTRLVKRGKEYVGLCVFHEEKTPSLYVNEAKSVYFCHGCGAKGDLVTYLILKRGFSWRKAISSCDDWVPEPIPGEKPMYSEDDIREETEEKIHAFLTWRNAHSVMLTDTHDDIAITDRMHKYILAHHETLPDPDATAIYEELQSLYRVREGLIRLLAHTDEQLFVIWEAQTHGA
jgi:DNA primase